MDCCLLGSQSGCLRWLPGSGCRGFPWYRVKPAAGPAARANLYHHVYFSQRYFLGRFARLVNRVENPTVVEVQTLGGFPSASWRCTDCCGVATAAASHRQANRPFHEAYRCRETAPTSQHRPAGHPTPRVPACRNRRAIAQFLRPGLPVFSNALRTCGCIPGKTHGSDRRKH